MKKQTKESFEAYLLQVKKEASEIKSLPTTYPHCPFCSNGTPMLVIENMTHCIPPHIWTGEMYAYKCGSCNEKFTTNESDAMSIATLNIKTK